MWMQDKALIQVLKIHVNTKKSYTCKNTSNYSYVDFNAPSFFTCILFHLDFNICFCITQESSVVSLFCWDSQFDYNNYFL